MCSSPYTLVFIPELVYWYLSLFLFSFGVHTAAQDLQSTSDPILCGGTEPLHSVMASVLPAEAPGHQKGMAGEATAGEEGAKTDTRVRLQN